MDFAPKKSSQLFVAPSQCSDKVVDSFWKRRNLVLRLWSREFRWECFQCVLESHLASTTPNRSEKTRDNVKNWLSGDKWLMIM